MDPVTAKYELEKFLLEMPECVLRREGGRVAMLGIKERSFTVEWGKLIFSFWGDGFAESWRVDDYQIRGLRAALRCSRQAGRVNAEFELVAPESEDDTPAEARARRRLFEREISALIPSVWLDARVESHSSRRDDIHHLSSLYSRLIVSRGAERFAALTVDPHEPPPVIDGALGAAILWYRRVRERDGRRAPEKLAIFLPEGQWTVVAERLTLIDKNLLDIALFEVSAKRDDLRPVQPFDQGSLSESLQRTFTWPPRVREEVRARAEELQSIAPEVLRVSVRPDGSACLLTVRGLEVARVWFDRQVLAQIGVPPDAEPLDERERTRFEQFVLRVAMLRSPASRSRSNPFFRLQAERWLQSLLLDNIAALDVTLDERFVYPQVPAYKGADRSFIDLLSVKRSGRLVVVELKVTEDPELPFQGLDYWLRVHWHLQNGDFQRRGYFRGIELSNEPPLLFLVAPRFRFHATFETLARCIDASVPVYRIAINDSWRNGVRVLDRCKVNG